MRTRALLATATVIASSCATQHTRSLPALGKLPESITPLLGEAHVANFRDGAPHYDSRRSIRDKILPRATDILAIAGLPSVTAPDAPSADQLTCSNLGEALCAVSSDHTLQLAAIAVARQCFRDFDMSGREDARGALLRCAISDDDTVREAIAALLVERGILGERAASLIPRRHQWSADRGHHRDLTACGLDTPRDGESLMIACREVRPADPQHDDIAITEYRLTASGWSAVAEVRSWRWLRPVLVR